MRLCRMPCSSTAWPPSITHKHASTPCVKQTNRRTRAPRRCRRSCMFWRMPPQSPAPCASTACTNCTRAPGTLCGCWRKQRTPRRPNMPWRCLRGALERSCPLQRRQLQFLHPPQVCKSPALYWGACQERLQCHRVFWPSHDSFLGCAFLGCGRPAQATPWGHLRSTQCVSAQFLQKIRQACMHTVIHASVSTADGSEAGSGSGLLTSADSAPLGAARSVRDMQMHARDETAAQVRWSLKGEARQDGLARSLRAAVSTPSGAAPEGRPENVWDATLGWLQGTLPAAPFYIHYSWMSCCWPIDRIACFPCVCWVAARLLACIFFRCLCPVSPFRL